MPTIDTYRKQAKQLVRWHRERNYSIGEKFRLLERYRDLTDAEALNTPLPLTLAQEIVAVEAGFESWAVLKSCATNVKPVSTAIQGKPTLQSAVPILFVRDVGRPGDDIDASIHEAVQGLDVISGSGSMNGRQQVSDWSGLGAVRPESMQLRLYRMSTGPRGRRIG